MEAAVTSLSPEEADQKLPAGRVFFGTNARVVSARAKRVLGWAPSGHSLEAEIPLSFVRELETARG